MKLILFLLRASWRVVLMAALIGGLSGAASMGLMITILDRLDALKAANAGAAAEVVGLFVGLCVVILLTQVGSQVLLSRLTQTTVAQLQLGLCRRILESPLKHLEEIGTPRMLASLTGDVSVVSQAMNGVPVLGVNIVILVCGAGYLGWLSPTLRPGLVPIRLRPDWGADLGTLSPISSRTAPPSDVRRWRRCAWPARPSFHQAAKSLRDGF